MAEEKAATGRFQNDIDFFQLLLVVLSRKVMFVFMAVGILIGLGMQLRSQESSLDEVTQIQKGVEMDFESIYDDYLAEATDWINGGREVNGDMSMLERLYYEATVIYYMSYFTTLKSQPKYSNTTNNRSGLLGMGYRTTIISTLAAVFAGMFLVGSYYLFWGVVLSADELNKSYGLNEIGVLSEERRFALRNGRDHSLMKLNREQQLRIACANLSVYLSDADSFLMVGTIPDDEMSRVADLLRNSMEGMNICTAPGINDNAASIEMIKRHENIVIVEKVLSSRYDEVDREVQLIMNSNKRIIGSIGIY